MHGEGATLVLARISENFQAAMRTSWRFKWRYAGEWFAENQPWSVRKNSSIDVVRLLVQLNVDEAEIAKRRAEWKAPEFRYTRGVLGKYHRLVGTASKEAVTD